MFLLNIITFALVIFISVARVHGHGPRIPPPIEFAESSFLTMDGVLALLELFVYPVTAWASIIAPSFMLSVLAAVVANEFDTCNSDLEQTMRTANTISLGEFSKMTDNFHDLAMMVKKVDAMFSKSVALNLASSLGSLCVAVYTIDQGQNVTTWTLALSCPALTLITLIPSLTSLNTKVSNTKLTYLSTLIWLNLNHN